MASTSTALRFFSEAATEKDAPCLAWCHHTKVQALALGRGRGGTIEIMIKRFISILAATTVLTSAFVSPALAQTNSAAQPTAADQCATANAALQQLPTPPDAAALSVVPASPGASAPTTYTDTVVPGRGIEISAGQIVGDTRMGATFIGDVAGDLPGVLASSVNYVPPAPGPGVTNTIVGGQWALCGAWGTVFGSFTGGTVQWNADETLADVVSQMRVLGGSVNHMPVSGGAGSFVGVLDHRPLIQGLPPTVSGTLQLQTSGSSMTSGALPNTGGPSLMLPILAAVVLLLLAGGLWGLGIVYHFRRKVTELL